MARLKEIHNSIESFLRRLSWSRVVDKYQVRHKPVVRGYIL